MEAITETHPWNNLNVLVTDKQSNQEGSSWRLDSDMFSGMLPEGGGSQKKKTAQLAYCLLKAEQNASRWQ